MSRKSRQKKGLRLLAKLPPLWILIPLLIIGISFGILGITSPWLRQPTPYEDTIPLSATMTEVEAHYRKHRRVDTIYLYFEDHDRLMFDSILSHRSLLAKLESFPAGTVFDMRLEPNGTDVMTLSVNGVDVFSYEAACRAIRFNNILGFALGIFMLFMSGYAVWALCITWKYRRLI